MRTLSSYVAEVNEINKTLLLSSCPVYKYKKFIEEKEIKIAIDVDSNAFRRQSDFVSRITKNQESELAPPEHKYRMPRKIDWELLNKKKSLTGMKGEEIALLIEQEYLQKIGKGELAEKVRHISKELGDGAGYDILSFCKNGDDKYIEVKATDKKSESFYISRNELDFIKNNNGKAFIYRISDVGTATPILEIITAEEVLNSREIIPTQFIVKAG